MNKKLIISIVVCLFFVVVSLWIWVIVPQLTKLPKDFSYKINVVSVDNFYDEEQHKFSGEKRSVTKFSYEVAGEKNGILTVKNVFDVRKVTGEKIFSVERLYGIDAKTGKHVAGFGDKTRDGYLFAPRDLKKSEPFTYWHINYDGPARMKFANEEDINGLHVYRYETRYEGVRIDQTKNLGNLPGVGVTRGVELEPYLQLWIEPVSGRMVKYKDDTIAYYYNLKTGEKLNPWNHFSNTYKLESVLNQVELAKQEKLNLIFIEYIAPALFMLLLVLIILFQYRKNKTTMFLIVFISTIVLLFLGYFVMEKNLIQKQSTISKSIEKITIADAHEQAYGLIYIALQNGYFKDEGLEVKFNTFGFSREALVDVAIVGNSDIATVYETPFVRKIYEGQDLSIISSLHKSTTNTALVAVKKKGIKSIQDLKGKVIAVTKGINAEFFLFTLLSSNGVKIEDVKIVDALPVDMEKVLKDGSVDAVAIFNVIPFLAKIQSIFSKDEIITFYSDTYTENSVLAGKTEVVKNKKEAITRLLKALVRAEDFYKSNREESIQAIAKSLTNIPESIIRNGWENYNLSLNLDNVLLTFLNREGQWFTDNGIYKTEAPNFRNAIFIDYLKSVKPEAVTLY